MTVSTAELIQADGLSTQAPTSQQQTKQETVSTNQISLEDDGAHQKKRFRSSDRIKDDHSTVTHIAPCSLKRSSDVDILDDMKFMSLDLRKQLRSIEKSIATMEAGYLQNSYSLDGHTCNLLSGFSSNICLKSTSSEVPLDAELKAEQLRQKKIALTRSLLGSAGAMPITPSRLEEIVEPMSSTASPAASSPYSTIHIHQCLFSLTSLSSPIMSQLAIRKDPY